MMHAKTVVVLAAILFIGAHAQETLSAVDTLATHAASDFVYVPSTLVSGAISVSYSVFQPDGQLLG